MGHLDGQDMTAHFEAINIAASFTVNDLPASLAWYRDVVGFSVDQEHARDGVLRAVSLRASGVRKSWEMPASKIVRLASNACTCCAILLKVCASSASSSTPSSFNFSGVLPWPIYRAATASVCSGRVIRLARIIAVNSANTIVAIIINNSASGDCTPSLSCGKPMLS